MITITTEYLGALRCKAIHEPSGAEIFTDAPLDNRGKGEMFSPTDLLATSLATCIATVMGIQAELLKIDLTGMKIITQKHMSSSAPRRIQKIILEVYVPGKYSERHEQLLMSAANSCPIHKSLHPDIEEIVNFHWGTSK